MRKFTLPPKNPIHNWNFKIMEGFFLDDSYFFNEYWIYLTKNLIKEFKKKNQKKGKFLFELLEKTDITVNFSWLISVSSFFWYTPDKILNISLWYREKIDMYKIITEDNYSILITPWQQILTSTWYKKAKDLTSEDLLLWVLWKAKRFKRAKKYEDITSIIENIFEYWDVGDWYLDLTQIPEKYYRYLNILWINNNTLDKKITKKEFLSLLKKEEEKEKNLILFSGSNDISKKENEELFRKNIFVRKIKSIEVYEMKNVYIWNITTNLSINLNVNNFILKQWK